MKADVKQLIKSIQAFSQSVSQDIEDMKTVVDRTFDIVVDSRYKVLQNISGKVSENKISQKVGSLTKGGKEGNF